MSTNDIPASDKWTEERVAELKQLWERYSAREIADLFACGLSRNAVIGKAFRLGLSQPRPALPTQPHTPRRPPRKPRTESRPPREKTAPEPPAKSISVRRITSTGIITTVQAETVADLQPESSKHAVDVSSLEARHCRYPIGKRQGTERFCGKRRVLGAYCKRHARVCYTTAAQFQASVWWLTKNWFGDVDTDVD